MVGSYYRSLLHMDFHAIISFAENLRYISFGVIKNGLLAGFDTENATTNR